MSMRSRGIDANACHNFTIRLMAAKTVAPLQNLRYDAIYREKKAKLTKSDRTHDQYSSQPRSDHPTGWVFFLERQFKSATKSGQCLLDIGPTPQLPASLSRRQTQIWRANFDPNGGNVAGEQIQSQCQNAKEVYTLGHSSRSSKLGLWLCAGAGWNLERI
mgnify:CR=1 FL=1